MPNASIVETFRASLRRELIQPVDQDYDEARKLYNAMVRVVSENGWQSTLSARRG